MPTNGAGVSERQEDWTLNSIFEDWIADRKLSRRKIAFLKQNHQMNLHGDGLEKVCPTYFCCELDIPNGSLWSWAVAELLDFLEDTTKHKFELEFPNAETPQPYIYSQMDYDHMM